MPAMLFQTTKQDLLALISPAATATTSKGNLPDLAHLLFDAQPDNRLRITGTDLQISIAATGPAQVTSGGRLCVESRVVSQLVSSCPAGGIEFKLLDGGWVQFRSLAAKTKLTMKLHTFAAENFPSMVIPKTETPPTKVDVAALRALLDATMYAVSRDEARANLNGLHVEKDGDRVMLVSTDGHRLAKADGLFPFPSLPDRGINIPYRSARILTDFLGGMDGTVDIGVMPGMLTVQGGNVSMAMKLSDHVFPPWQQVVPTAFSRRCTVNKAALVTTIERAMVMAPDKTHSTVLAIEPQADGGGELVVTVDNAEQGTLRDVLGLEERVRLEGNAVSTMYNAQYVLEAIEHTTGDTIVMRSNGAMDPVNISSIGPGGDIDLRALAIVMPMRM